MRHHFFFLENSPNQIKSSIIFQNLPSFFFLHQVFFFFKLDFRVNVKNIF